MLILDGVDPTRSLSDPNGTLPSPPLQTFSRNVVSFGLVRMISLFGLFPSQYVELISNIPESWIYIKLLYKLSFYETVVK
jgi:hypothetical protein